MKRKKVTKKTKKILKLTEPEQLRIQISDLKAEVIKHKMARITLELALRKVEQKQEMQLLDRSMDNMKRAKNNHASSRSELLNTIRSRLDFTGEFSYDPDTLEVFINDGENQN